MLAHRRARALVRSAASRGAVEVLLPWAELAGGGPRWIQRGAQSAAGHHQLGWLCPPLFVFADGLVAGVSSCFEQLGAAAVSLIGWAWQRRAILGDAVRAIGGRLPEDGACWLFACCVRGMARCEPAA